MTTPLKPEFQELLDRNESGPWIFTIHTDNSSVGPNGRNTGVGVNPTTFPATIGHASVTIQAPNGEKVEAGYWPKHPGQYADDAVVHRDLAGAADQAHVLSEDGTFSFRITGEQARQGLRTISDTEATPGRYEGLTNNCATFAQTVAHSVGLPQVSARSDLATGMLAVGEGAGAPARPLPGPRVECHDPAQLEATLRATPEGRAAEQLAKELGTRSQVPATASAPIPAEGRSDAAANYSRGDGQEVRVDAQHATRTPAQPEAGGAPGPSTVAPTPSTPPADRPREVNVRDLPDARKPGAPAPRTPDGHPPVGGHTDGTQQPREVNVRDLPDTGKPGAPAPRTPDGGPPVGGHTDGMQQPREVNVRDLPDAGRPGAPAAKESGPAKEPAGQSPRQHEAHTQPGSPERVGQRPDTHGTDPRPSGPPSGDPRTPQHQQPDRGTESREGRDAAPRPQAAPPGGRTTPDSGPPTGRLPGADLHPVVGRAPGDAQTTPPNRDAPKVVVRATGFGPDPGAKPTTGTPAQAGVGKGGAGKGDARAPARETARTGSGLTGREHGSGDTDARLPGRQPPTASGPPRNEQPPKPVVPPTPPPKPVPVVSTTRSH